MIRSGLVPFARGSLACAFCAAAAAGLALLAGFEARAGGGHAGAVESMALRRGEFPVRWVEPAQGAAAKCAVILASGDGGWSGWEDAVAGHLAAGGCLVAGMDMEKYAATDFDEETLGADFAAVAGTALARAGQAAVPVIYAGWSMGAVEVVPAGAFAGRPPNVKGLLMISAGKRGRFGLRFADRAGLPPTGKGTFALADFTERLQGLRVAQIQGGADFISSTEWIESLAGGSGGKGPAEVRLFRVKGANHGLNGPDAAGMAVIDAALAWLLGESRAAQGGGGE